MFQSLLQPLRPKDPPAPSSAGGEGVAASPPAAAPGSNLTSPLSSRPGSPRRLSLSQASFDPSPAIIRVGSGASASCGGGSVAGSGGQAGEGKSHLGEQQGAGAAAAAWKWGAWPAGGAVQGAGYQVPQPSPYGGPQQQQPQQQQYYDASSCYQGQAAAAAPAQWPRLMQLQAAGTGLLQGAAGSGDWADLRNVIRNPAAALSSLSSFTAKLGNQLQPGWVRCVDAAGLLWPPGFGGICWARAVKVKSFVIHGFALGLDALQLQLLLVHMLPSARHMLGGPYAAISTCSCLKPLAPPYSISSAGWKRYLSGWGPQLSWTT